jgi:hypothetical protein
MLLVSPGDAVSKPLFRKDIELFKETNTSEMLTIQYE